MRNPIAIETESFRIHPRKKSKTNVYGFLKDPLAALSYCPTPL